MQDSGKLHPITPTAIVPSPFAFTGDKFEFRAVGACSQLCTCHDCIEQIMANRLLNLLPMLISLLKKTNIKKMKAIFQGIENYVQLSRKNLFEGNGYGENGKRSCWKRSSYIPDTPRGTGCIQFWQSQKRFSAMQMYYWKELESRYHIKHACIPRYPDVKPVLVTLQWTISYPRQFVSGMSYWKTWKG